MNIQNFDYEFKFAFIFKMLNHCIMRLTFSLILVLCLTACTHTYYIVRHAEKAIITDSVDKIKNDPPLSEAGRQRVAVLKEILKGGHIADVFSTNTIRTKSTAQPVADYFGLIIQLYGPLPDSIFIEKLKKLKKNILVVGHSNTVDDIVNGLCHSKEIATDLQDNEYDNLFVVKYKNFFGTHIKFEHRKYGK